MKDKRKTKKQFINELVELRQRIAKLDKLENKRKKAEEELKSYHDHLEELVENRTYELLKSTEQLNKASDIFSIYAGLFF